MTLTGPTRPPLRDGHPPLAFRGGGMKENLRDALGLEQRLAKGLKQRAVDRIALRIIFGMPLHTERKRRRLRNSNGLDRAVLRDPLHHDPFAGIEDALTVQRIDADGVAAEQFGKGAASEKTDLM